MNSDIASLLLEGAYAFFERAAKDIHSKHFAFALVNQCSAIELTLKARLCEKNYLLIISKGSFNKKKINLSLEDIVKSEFKSIALRQLLQLLCELKFIRFVGEGNCLVCKYNTLIIKVTCRECHTLNFFFDKNKICCNIDCNRVFCVQEILKGLTPISNYKFSDCIECKKSEVVGKLIKGSRELLVCAECLHLL